MGIYRLILSIMVALSHSGIYYYGFNQGIVAVISFLIISGYATDIVLEKRENCKGSLSGFYFGRAINIFPLYWVYVILTFFVVWHFGLVHEVIQVISLKGILYNLLLFPLDYSAFNSDWRLTLAECNAIPAAWTLGMQLTYYLVAPLLYKLERNIKYGKIVNYGLFFISFLVFLCSIAGKISSNYSYTLLPGTLWMFMLGMYMRQDNKKEFLKIVTIICMILFLYAGYSSSLIGQSREILLGVVIGIPAIYWLKDYPFRKIDAFLGKISYGVYLNHFTVKTVIMNIIGYQPSVLKSG